MNLINELRMLAEDLHVNGYNRYSAAMSKAADELDKWEAVFGHLGSPPDECGNAIIAARDEPLDRLEEVEKERDALQAKVERMEKRLRLILEEPENTMSNSKAMREMIRQARLALEESK